MITNSLNYIKTLIKWIIISVAVGLCGGVIGSLFNKCVTYVTNVRTANSWVIFLLPLGGVVIAFLYKFFAKDGKIDTNRVIRSVGGDEKVPVVMLPLIFVSTVITHFLGGSAGREGAALQLGGCMGYNFGKILKFKDSNMHIIVMAGMSSVFAALFGTPVTAAIFAVEVISVGIMRYSALVPCLISSMVAYGISLLFGIKHEVFDFVVFNSLDVSVMVKAVVLALLCAVVSIGFCSSIKYSEKYMKNLMPNVYIRGAVGGVIIITLTLLVGSYDYNGAGMNIVERAMHGEANPEAFILKIIFTAITIGAGFKGGEIVPTFFIGSTFGCVAGSLLGLEPGFGAAIGFVSMFCGVVNCPIASIMLSVEVFGAEAFPIFAVCCAISYMMSGRYGLYKSQKIVYSKLNENKIDAYAN